MYPLCPADPGHMLIPFDIFRADTNHGYLNSNIGNVKVGEFLIWKDDLQQQQQTFICYMVIISWIMNRYTRIGTKAEAYH